MTKGKNEPHNWVRCTISSQASAQSAFFLTLPLDNSFGISQTTVSNYLRLTSQTSQTTILDYLPQLYVIILDCIRQQPWTLLHSYLRQISQTILDKNLNYFILSLTAIFRLFYTTILKHLILNNLRQLSIHIWQSQAI